MIKYYVYIRNSSIFKGEFNTWEEAVEYINNANLIGKVQIEKTEWYSRDSYNYGEPADEVTILIDKEIK